MNITKAQARIELMIYRLVVSAQGTMSGKIKFIEIILDFIVYLNRKYVTIWVSLIAPK